MYQTFEARSEALKVSWVVFLILSLFLLLKLASCQPQFVPAYSFGGQASISALTEPRHTETWEEMDKVDEEKLRQSLGKDLDAGAPSETDSSVACESDL